MSSTLSGHRITGKVLVRGSINIDEFFEVPHIVRSGETLSSTGFSRRPGGKGANQAVSAAKAGAQVSFAGHVGSDGLWLKEALSRYGVGTSLLRLDEDLPTGRAIIQLSTSTRDNSIVLLPGANASPARILTVDDISAFTTLLLQNEINLDLTRAALIQARKSKCVTIFNPSPMLSRDEAKAFPWDSLDWLIVNEQEAWDLIDLLTDSTAASTDPLATLRQVEAVSGLTGLIMTKGENGVSVATGGRDGDTVHIAAAQVLGDGVKDTTGAGDCFAGFFATLLSTLPPLPPISSSKLASLLNICAEAAAMCVEKDGAMDSVPTLKDVKARMGTRWTGEGSWEALL